MKNSNISIKNVGTKYYLEVFGRLNEDTNFSRLDLSQANEFVVNFKNVKQIESCGVREWLRLIRPFTHLRFTFINCPKIVIDLINMVDGFLPKNGVVASFYVPYYSEASGTTAEVLFKYGSEFDREGNLHIRQVIDEDGSLMELDVVEQRYFRFLRNGDARFQFMQNKFQNNHVPTSA